MCRKTETAKNRRLRRMSLTPMQKIRQNLYESLDFDTYHDLNKREKRLTRSQRYFAKLNVSAWLICFAIGVGTGVVGFFIDFSLKKIQAARHNVVMYIVTNNSYWEAFAANLAVSLALVLPAAILVVLVEPVSAGSGIPEVKCFLNGIKVPRLVRMKTLFAKALGIVFSVSAGLPVGKEGPMIHSGSVIGGGVSQADFVTLRQSAGGQLLTKRENRLSRFFREFRNDKNKRDFVAVGSAAGVSAAFGAPIGGVLFALEEGASHFNQQLIWQAFLAAMMSSFTLNVLTSGTELDDGWGLLKYPALVTFGGFGLEDDIDSSNPNSPISEQPTFSKHRDYNLYDIGFFILIGIAGGLFGALFNSMNHSLTLWRQKHLKVTSTARRLAEVLLITTVVNAVLFLLPYYWKVCRCAGNYTQYKENLQIFYCAKTCEVDGNVQTTMTYNSIATLTVNPLEVVIKHLYHQLGSLDSELTQNTLDYQFTPQSLMVLFVVYFLLACWTYGIAVPSGLFVPSLLSGAIGGRLIGELLVRTGMKVDPGLYALVGSAAMLVGMARMTISLCCILIEATDGIKFGLPLMVTLLFAKWVGDYFNEGLYDIHIHLKHAPLLHYEPPREADLLEARNIMSKAVHSMPQIVRVRDVVHLLEQVGHFGFPIVEKVAEQGTRVLRGLILRHQLCVLLYTKKAFVGSVTNAYMSQPPMSWDDFDMHYPRYPNIGKAKSVLTSADMEMMIDLGPYMNKSPYIIQERASAERCYALFRLMGLRHLLVISSTFEVRGVITRKDLTSAWIAEQLADENESRKHGTYTAPPSIGEPSDELSNSGPC